MLLQLSPVVETPSAVQAPGDCRVYERRPCEVPTTCQPASLLAMKEPGWSATIRDISQGGVRLHVTRRFEKGTPLAIELPGDRDHEASVVFVNVVYVKRLDDGSWTLGCRFVCELNDDEMERLVTWGPSAPDRSKPTPAPFLSAAPSVAENRILANVHLHLHLAGGRRIACVFTRFNAGPTWPLAPGKILRFNGHRGDQTKWSLRVQLVGSQQEGESWHLQATLLPTPNVPDWLQSLTPRQ